MFFIMPYLQQRVQNRAIVFWESYTLNGNSYCDELAFADVNLFVVLARVFKKLKIGGNRNHHRASSYSGRRIKDNCGQGNPSFVLSRHLEQAEYVSKKCIRKQWYPK